SCPSYDAPPRHRPLFPTRRPSDLSALIQVAAEAAGESFTAKGVRLQADSAACTATAIVDSQRIGQVLGNLLSNALRHTPVGGERSEEHTSELQSRFDLVCRLLLEQ